MQRYAIDGGALNGDPIVYSDGGDANITFDSASATLAIGLGLAGAADITLAPALPLAIGLVLGGAADITFSQAGTPSLLLPVIGGATITFDGLGDSIRGASLVGDAAITFDAQGNGTRWAMLAGGGNDITFDPAGDLQAVSPTSASFTIQFDANFDLLVGRGQALIGDAAITLDGNLLGHVGRSVPIMGTADVAEFAPWLTPRLIMQCPPGGATIAVSADGEGRTNQRVYLESREPAAIEFAAFADLAIQHRVYASADFVIEVRAEAARHGTPIIPAEYQPAPPDRLMRVAAERRLFIVQAERR